MFFWISLAVGILFAAIMMVHTAKKHRESWRLKARIWTQVWWIPLAMVPWLMTTIVWNVSYAASDYNATGEVKLAAIATDASIKGHFFLFSGTIGDKLTYRFFAETAPGEYAYKDIPAYRGAVIEDAGDPYLELRYLCADWISPWQECSNAKYVFHIPEGSILRTYEMAP